MAAGSGHDPLGVGRAPMECRVHLYDRLFDVADPDSAAAATG
jgi:hypothetical protein